MIKNVVLIFLLISGNIAFSQSGIHFEKTKWQDIIAKAKKENKIIFMDAYTTWCGPCKKMSKEVFTDQKVGDFFNKNMINAKIEMETDEGPIIASQYPVRAYPTLFFIDPNSGKILDQAIGYQTAENLLKIAEKNFNAKTKKQAN